MPGLPGVFFSAAIPLRPGFLMFDISFFELFVIGVVALVVIGPERLPKVARTAGHLFGRMQRYVNDVKADINREMELEELRKLRSEFEGAAESMKESMKQVTDEVHAAESEIQKGVASLNTPDTVASSENPNTTPAVSEESKAK